MMSINIMTKRRLNIRLNLIGKEGNATVVIRMGYVIPIFQVRQGDLPMFLCLKGMNRLLFLIH